MKKRLMAIWRKPTWIHVLALADFLKIVEINIEKDLFGIYTICRQSASLASRISRATRRPLGLPKALPSPGFSRFMERRSAVKLLRRYSGRLPRSAVIWFKWGMTCVVADTSRMKRELVPRLIFPTLVEA